MKPILLSPHDDDSHLFAAFTCMRLKPLVIVCTDSFIQPNRGEVGCSAEERAEETRKACRITGNEVIRLGIKDTELTEENLHVALLPYMGATRVVYAPAVQGGNAQHDMVGKVAKQFFPLVMQYTTYTKTELWTKGETEIIPTEHELAVKKQALEQYQSQIRLGATRPHFDAVEGKSEFYL